MANNYVDLVDEDEEAPPKMRSRQTIIAPRASPKGVAVKKDKLISIYAKQEEATRSYKKQNRGKRKMHVVRRPRKKHKQNTYSLLNTMKSKSTYLKGKSSEMPINVDDDSDTDMTADVSVCLGAPPAEATDPGNPHSLGDNASIHQKITAGADDPRSLTANTSNHHKITADEGDVPADMDDLTMAAHAIDYADKVTNVQDCHTVAAEVGDRQDVPANSGACNGPFTSPKKYAENVLYTALTRLSEIDDSNVEDVNATFDALTPDVIGDDLMYVLLQETPAKRFCQRELTRSKNPLIARRSSQLLSQWRQWLLNSQAEREDESGARNDDDKEKSVEYCTRPSILLPQLPTPAPAVRVESPTPAPAVAMTQSPQLSTLTGLSQHDNAQPNTAECVDLAMDNDSDNDSGILSQSSPARALTELQRTQDSQDEKVDFGTAMPTR